MYSHNGYESPILPSSMSSDILNKNGGKFQDTGRQRKEDMLYKFEIHWLYIYNMPLGTAHTDSLLLVKCEWWSIISHMDGPLRCDLSVLNLSSISQEPGR